MRPLHFEVGPVCQRLPLCLLLASTLATRAHGEASQALGPRKADLQANTALDKRLELTPKSTVTDLLDQLCRVSGKGIVILGSKTGDRLPLADREVPSLQGKPAREALRLLADRFKTDLGAPEWEEYGEFYLLYPPGVERHNMKPVSFVSRNPALKRKVSGTFLGLLAHVLEKIGRSADVVLITGAVGAPQPARQRYTYPAAVTVHERTADEVMQALTALTGDPWDRLDEAYVLSLAGKPLTHEQRTLIARSLAHIHLVRSFTPEQAQLMTRAEGLTPAQLSLRQRQALVAVTASMREAWRASPDQLLLRRHRTGEQTFSSEVYVYAQMPDRLQEIGVLTMR